ncbi:MAG: hypothetical protein GX350_03965 [Erysipelotrichaceae bacterium]|nr:hypothetical protein [Erysipelotrichaceae bacterium]
MLGDVTDEVLVGFAFKTVGDQIRGGGGNELDDWWFAPGHFPANAAEAYRVTVDGLFAQV